MEENQKIEERNARVELDKAWETSKIRRALIATITYCVATYFLWRIGIEEPFANALVPTGGYILSTLTLPKMKHHWMKKYGED